jgi:hypothetical protein
MRRILLILATVSFAGSFCTTSFAQQFKWVDQNGRIQYGDTPPPGAKATRLRPPPPGSPPPAAAKGAPLTAAEKDAAFRKRQQDAEKDRQKDEVAAKDADAKRENCERSKEYLRMLEGGLRISRLNAQGERYYISDDERAAEVAQTRQNVSQSCGN